MSESPSKPNRIVIEVACRDDGGPLTCRECGCEIDRSLNDHYYVESPHADCRSCYMALMAELEDED